VDAAARQGNSALVAAVGLYDLMKCAEGARRGVVVATDDRQAGTARRVDLAFCAIMAHSVAATVEPRLLLYRYDEVSKRADRQLATEDRPCHD
jgi:hypothetical protein